MKQGWDVIALHRETSDISLLQSILGGFPGSRWRLAVGDINAPESLQRSMPEGCVVFHVAASTEAYYKKNEVQTLVNVDGTRNVVKVALEKKVRRFIHTSSTAAYSTPVKPGMFITEADPKRGENHWINYCRTKFLAEVEVRKGIDHGLDAVILNPSHVSGKYDTSSWAQLIRITANGTLPGVGPGSGNWCHGVEVARAHIAAVEKGVKGENYILGGPTHTFSEVVVEIKRALGIQPPSAPRVLPSLLIWALAYTKETVAMVTGKEPDLTREKASFLTEKCCYSSEKAVRVLGFNDKVPMADMIRESALWLKDQGML